MICGIHDLLVAPDDYLWLYEELQENGNEVNFQEYELGHQGLQFPKDKTSVNDVLDQVMQDYDYDSYFKYSKERQNVIHHIRI